MASILSQQLSDLQMACVTAAKTKGEVPYDLRVRLHEAARSQAPVPGFGRAFDCLVFTACARRSFPLWRRYNEGGDELDQFEGMVMGSLNGSISLPEVERFLVAADALVMERYYDGSPQFQNTAGLAGLSCIRALSVAAGAFEFDRDQSHEIEIDPHQWDSAFLSGCALAGGAEWQAGDEGAELDEDARGSFWRWYAETAVPKSIEGASSAANGPAA